ncbi:hypothetical protein Taro_050046 [Colocasia esculenta]|uniref:Uncharacterized protein n=1 Tax=Colocasia esculenta TaxID=4460 RepID=A0A843XCG1_COLES|nr:hypothetical protein [Colocasia esculenta]
MPTLLLMDGRVGRLRSESADSESGRPLATRLWGGNTDPPTGQSGLVYQADSGRLRPTQAESGPTQGRDRLGPTQPPDPTLPSLLLLPFVAISSLEDHPSETKLTCISSVMNACSDFSDNMLSGSIPSTFTGLPFLQRLDISDITIWLHEDIHRPRIRVPLKT